MSYHSRAQQIYDEIECALNSEDEKRVDILVEELRVIVSSIPDSSKRELGKLLLLNQPTIHKAISEKRYDIVRNLLESAEGLFADDTITPYIQTMLTLVSTEEDAVSTFYFKTSMQLLCGKVTEYFRISGLLVTQWDSDFKNFVAKTSGLDIRKSGVFRNPYSGRYYWPAIVVSLDLESQNFLSQTHGKVYMYVDARNRSILLAAKSKDGHVFREGPLYLR